jgi:hypothetical protein
MHTDYSQDKNLNNCRIDGYDLILAKKMNDATKQK